MRKLIAIILILFSVLANIPAQEKFKEKSKKWSYNQGKMNWYDARDKCASIGMRLPTRDELLLVQRFGYGKIGKKKLNISIIGRLIVRELNLNIFM